MANEIRVRSNFKSGTITDNPLTLGATTFNSAALAGLDVIDSTDHMVVILDPLGAGNGPEIVYVTEHTSGATVASIVRGREGTSGVQHAQTTPWIAGVVASDVPFIGTSGPSAGGLPYRGEIRINPTTGALEVYYGATTGWRPPWNTEWGVVPGSRVEVTANTGVSHAEAATGLVTTYTQLSGRSYAVKVKWEWVVETTVGGVVVATLRVGDTSGSAQLDRYTERIPSNSEAVSAFWEYREDAASSGSVTRAVRFSATTTSTTVNLSASSGAKAYIEVEDVGPSGNPA